MEQRIKALQEQMMQRIGQIDNKEKLAAFWQDFLGKKGAVADLMKGLGAVAKEDRPAMGKVINEFKVMVENQYQGLSAKMDELELAARNRREQVDITLPGKEMPLGGLHPLTLVKNEMINVFAGMGFEIFEGPEIEDDDHNFTRLNVPKDHPSRDMQDTFYLENELLLRTQTSGGQIRVMDSQKPPIKVLVPGRVFRSDSDATHSPMFHQMEGLVVDKGITLCDLQGMLDKFVQQIHQMEGLVVDKGITLCDLQGMLDKFVQQIFDADVRTRLRPSYFPFTEPSVEVDVSCFECGGKGCGLCKHTGWIEVLGGGVVHPHVLENCGIDPNVYSGIAFGIGIERITMLKYGINNIGLLFENDMRFLEQFRE